MILYHGSIPCYYRFFGNLEGVGRFTPAKNSFQDLHVLWEGSFGCQVIDPRRHFCSQLSAGLHGDSSIEGGKLPV